MTEIRPVNIQFINRDTTKFAVKLTGGKEVNVFKDHISTTKKSKTGKLKLIRL